MTTRKIVIIGSAGIGSTTLTEEIRKSLELEHNVEVVDCIERITTKNIQDIKRDFKPDLLIDSDMNYAFDENSLPAWKNTSKSNWKKKTKKYKK